MGSGNGSTLLSLATSGWRRLTGVDYSISAVKLAASIARRKVEDGWLKGFHVVELTGEEEEEESELQEKDEASQENISVQRLSAAAPSQNASLCPYLAFAVYDLTITPSSSSSSTLINTNPSTDKTSPLKARPPHPKFDVILDKGTFDAISLCPDEAERKKNLYVDFVRTVLKEEEEEEEVVGGRGGIFCLTSCNWTEDELVKIFGQHFTLKDRIEFPSFQFGGKSGSTVTSLVFKKNKCSL